ncbi:MAG: hypothetical protein J6V90_08505 [Treponema sp.]|nr:hypothetical protein [Treponema sp.]
MSDELYKSFVTMLWYQNYEEVILNMLSKQEKDGIIPYDDKNGFSEEVWSVLVLMFGEYGVAPRYGWIEKVTEFKTFLQKVYTDMTKDDYSGEKEE